MLKTWHKWGIGLGVAGIALVGIALVVIAFTVDPAAYRGRIEAAASQAVGRPVTIDGRIGLHVLPWFEVAMRDVRVGKNSPGDDAPLATAQRVTVTPRPLALLTGRLAVGTITIDGLSLRLRRDSEGRSNWQGVLDAIAAGPGQSMGAPSSSREQPVRAPGLPVASLAVGAVRLVDADIDYQDARAGRHWRLSQARLQTGRMTDGSPFRLEASGRLSRAGAETQARLHLVTQIEPHLADRFYRFSDLGVNLLVIGSAIPGGKQEANLGASGEIDLSAGRFGLDSVSLQTAGASLTGKIDGEGLGHELSYNGRITIAAFSPRSVLQQLELTPPATRSAAALTRAGFDAQFSGDRHAVHFKQVAAQLDRSHLTGTAEIADFARPRLRFDLALDTLDIDDYLPPARRDAGKPATDAAAPGLPTAWRWATPHGLRARGQLTVDALTAAGIRADRAETQLAARAGRIDIDSFTAAAYGGRVALQGRIASHGGRNRIEVAGRLRHIEVAGLLADALGRHDLRGMADVDLDLSTAPTGPAALAGGLNGQLSLHLTDASLTGYDLVAAMRRHSPAAAPQSTASQSPATTPLGDVQAVFDVADGLFRTQRFQLQSPGLAATGQGTYRLPDNALDYRLHLQVADQPDSALAGLAGQRMTVKMAGSLFAPGPSFVNAPAATADAAPEPGPDD